MSVSTFKHVFGPVRSRRLGRSLGVNNVPYKTCTYSCIYCQLGRTTNLTVERRTFYNLESTVSEVSEFIGSVSEDVDYVTFVPDGEPLLDINIGREIFEIKNRVPKPVAVLTNASLLFREDAREDLLNADFVSVKIDVLKEGTWEDCQQTASGPKAY
ncbi:MAG: radical SAM protein [Nitrososphaerota archaeon]